MWVWNLTASAFASAAASMSRQAFPMLPSWTDPTSAMTNTGARLPPMALPMWPLVRQPLLHLDRGDREYVCDARTGAAVAVEPIGRVPAMLQLAPDRRRDLGRVVAHIDHVASTRAAVLPRADVDGWHTEIGALANRGTRIPYHAGRTLHQPHIDLDRNVLV